MTVDQAIHNRPLKEVSYWRGSAALTLGIISVALTWYLGAPSLVMGILAIVFGKNSRAAFDVVHLQQCQPKHPKSGLPISRGVATAGFVLGIIGTVSGAISFLVWIAVLASS